MKTIEAKLTIIWFTTSTLFSTQKSTKILFMHTDILFYLRFVHLCNHCHYLHFILLHYIHLFCFRLKTVKSMVLFFYFIICIGYIYSYLEKYIYTFIDTLYLFVIFLYILLSAGTGPSIPKSLFKSYFYNNSCYCFGRSSFF